MQTLKPSLVSLPPLPQKSQNPNPIIPAAGDDHRRHDPNHLRTIHTLIDQCTSIRHLEQIHAHILTTGSFSHSYTATKLFTAFALSSFSSLDYALKVFEDMPQPNLYSWNTLIRAFASSHEPIIGVLMFIRMRKESELCPNNFTFPFVIKAAAACCELRVGQSVHGLVVKGGSDLDVFTTNSLIHFYAMCGDLDSAWLVFGRIVEKDVVSWNSMINGFGQGGCPDKAVELFKRMEMEHVRPNAITVVSLLSACARKGDLEFGRWVCEYIERNGIDVNLNVSNAMLDLYVKCGSIEDAKRLFDEMEEKDVVSWTTMIDGYAKIGEYEMARSVFYAMPRQEITAWNVLISAYEQNGKPKEALAIFRELQLRENVKPDKVTLLSTLSACAQLGALDLGVWIHLYIEKQGIKLNCHLTTALIDMYSKSGELKKALDVFYSAERRDVFVWSSMISGLAMHGRGREAIDLFVKMQEAKVKPNVVTFTNLLAACSHSGLVDEGRAFFGQMEPVYGIVPGSRHYACMVDVLARAGHLEEAFEFAEKIPIEPSASVWVALLGACRVLENVELAEKACTRLLKIEPENHGAYVLLSNIYAKTGKWNSVSGLRHDMKVSGLKKEPGCSSIEVNGTIHEFRVGDNSHHLSKDIYSKLDEIIGTLKSKGYVPNKSHLLQCIEEDDMKEIALNHHSEKLAIAFGLISTGSSQPIRIVKNIRVCGDCHTVAKLISKLYKREILLRDRYRYHHFSGGQCSCKDFW